jgi:hypothetical protein
VVLGGDPVAQVQETCVAVGLGGAVLEGRALLAGPLPPLHSVDGFGEVWPEHRAQGVCSV